MANSRGRSGKVQSVYSRRDLFEILRRAENLRKEEHLDLLSGLANIITGDYQKEVCSQMNPGDWVGRRILRTYKAPVFVWMETFRGKYRCKAQANRDKPGEGPFACLNLMAGGFSSAPTLPPFVQVKSLGDPRRKCTIVKCHSSHTFPFSVWSIKGVYSKIQQGSILK